MYCSRNHSCLCIEKLDARDTTWNGKSEITFECYHEVWLSCKFKEDRNLFWKFVFQKGSFKNQGECINYFLPWEVPLKGFTKHIWVKRFRHHMKTLRKVFSFSVKILKLVLNHLTNVRILGTQWFSMHKSVCIISENEFGMMRSFLQKIRSSQIYQFQRNKSCWAHHAFTSQVIIQVKRKVRMISP